MIQREERDAYYLLSSAFVAAEAVQALKNAPIDWPKVAELADKLDCPQTLYFNAKKYGLELLLESGRAEAWKRVVFESVTRGLYWMALRERIADAMEKAAVPFVLLKGASLAMRTYRDERFRRSWDLDILIRAEDFGSALKTLGSIGAKPASPTRRGVMVNPGQECEFALPDGGQIDVHYRFFPWYEEKCLYRIDAREFFARSVMWESRGRSYRLLKTEDEFYFSLLSFLGEDGRRFRFLIDADALARTHGHGWDWKGVERLLGRGPLRAPLASALSFLKAKLKTPMPVGAEGRWEDAEKRLFAAPLPAWRLNLAKLGAAETHRDRLYLAGVYFKWQFFKLFGWRRNEFLASNNPAGREF